MTNPLLWVILLTGAALLSRRSLPRLASFSAIGAVIVSLAMTPPAALQLTRWWEAAYVQPSSCQQTAPAKLIVLPGGVRHPDGLDDLSTLTLNSIVRLEASFALARAHESVPIVVAGTAREFQVINAIASRREHSFVLDAISGAENTLEAARAVADRYSKDDGPLWLVTSALHMRRSLLAFDDAGVEVCPVAADVTRTWRGVVPNHGSIRRLDALLHEVVGLVYYKARMVFGL
ncbi:MAG: YdcF family protein [Lysobacterales bacterium]